MQPALWGSSPYTGDMISRLKLITVACAVAAAGIAAAAAAPRATRGIVGKKGKMKYFTSAGGAAGSAAGGASSTPPTSDATTGLTMGASSDLHLYLLQTPLAPLAGLPEASCCKACSQWRQADAGGKRCPAAGSCHTPGHPAVLFSVQLPRPLSPCQLCSAPTGHQM